MNIERALQIAEKAHRGQFRKGGLPYVTHPLAVRELVKEYYNDPAFAPSGPEYEYLEDAEIVAILHDVVEDSDITLDDLEKEGFHPIVLEAVDAMTERDGDTYVDKVMRATRNQVSRLVKYCDIEHNNSTTSRKKNKHKHDKYLLAQYILSGWMELK